MQAVISHPGPAHFDEFLAIALLLVEKGSENTPVYRREPTGEEIDNARVAVVDTGHEYNEDLLLFDHHQSAELPSSMWLVADYLGYLEPFRQAFDWFEFKDTLDVAGPKEAARQHGIDGDIRPTQSPVEAFVLRSFSEQEEIPLHLKRFMLGLAESLTQRAEEFAEKKRVFEYEMVPWAVQGVDAVVLESHVADSQVMRQLREEKGFDVTITKDPRSGDLTVYRYDDVDLDLYAASQDVEGVHFAHKSGFLATVEDVGTAHVVIENAIEENGAFATRY